MQRKKYGNRAAVDKPQEGQTGTAVHRAPVGQGPSGPDWLATALGFWILVWTGACYWHGVSGFVFNSTSSQTGTAVLAVGD